VDSEVSTSGLTVAEGDVTEPGCGLDERGRAWLASASSVRILHGAAEVRFDLPASVMRARNVDGTAHLLALARARGSRLERFDHISTAYVAGDREGLALETEVDVGQRPRNAYEASKLEAEIEVHQARQEGLPVAVHRPSIVVGDARTGRAASFKVLYWPLAVYARGRFRTVFGRAECPIDVVPVDFVADAILALCARPGSLGGCYHLCAGPRRQSSVGELAGYAQAELGGRPIRYVDPDVYLRYLRPVIRPLLRLIRPEVAEKGGVYLPYLRGNPSFDVSERERALAGSGLDPPPVERFFRNVLRYAVASDFGRRDPAAGQSLAR
jgi:long-chain acyl-CoA synthetase